jgi:hypothetical protein
MTKQDFEQWETRLQKTAESFPYPPTPNVALAVMTRLRQNPPQQASRQRLAWAAAWVVLLLVTSLAVPQVRAAVTKLLQIGAIQIWVGEPTATAVPLHLQPKVVITPTPQPATIADIAGQTSLNIAQGRADFDLQAPAYPSDLGPPDKVYLQERPYPKGQIFIFIWLNPKQPDKVRLTLYQIHAEDYAFKEDVEFVEETRVNREWALWVSGPHTLRLRNGRLQPWLFVEGNVLIWQHNNITYRLESGLSLDEAIKVAESLQTLNSEP